LENLLPPSDEIRVLAFEIQLNCTEYGLQKVLRKLKKFVNLTFAYSMFVLKMVLKYDLRELKKLLYDARHEA
jgi:hypothetical protein